MKLANLEESGAAAEKNLAVFPGALGDFVCFLPTLAKLAKRGEWDLLARTDYAPLVPANVSTHSLERYEMSRLFMAGAENDEKLRGFFGSYASIFSWMGGSQPDFVRHLQILSNGRSQIFPFRLPRTRMHMADYYLSCIGEKPSKEYVVCIPAKADAVMWGEAFRQQHGLAGSNVMVLAPGSGAREKNWPNEFYKAVAEWWERKFGGKVLVIFGPVEEEREETHWDWGHAVVVCSLDLARVAALLRRSVLYLGNDSGVSHLAGALGIETVVLFGPSDPIQWAPRGKRITIITQNVDCSPCTDSIMKACRHRSCLNTTNPDQVILTLEEILKKAQSFGGLERGIPIDSSAKCSIFENS